MKAAALIKEVTETSLNRVWQRVFILRMPKNTLPSLAGESQCVRKENIYDTGKD